ncbi:MAG: DUF2934 domain-containing protein [Rhodocyclaceae bacterium]|nr:DUF2934 domain-containing protein [Rhodocyclaceae bacterium]
MANEKTSTTRRKSSTETKAAISKPTVKTASKSKTAAVKAAPVKAAPKKTSVSKTEKPAEKKPAARKAKATGQPITAETRLRHIEIAAYYIAENSGFNRNPADCWIAAESEIDGLLLAGKLPT